MFKCQGSSLLLLLLFFSKEDKDSGFRVAIGKEVQIIEPLDLTEFCPLRSLLTDGTKRSGFLAMPYCRFFCKRNLPRAYCKRYQYKYQTSKLAERI